MADTSLRSALRFHTRDLHTRLDATVGAFDSLATYRAFLIRSYQFRAALEPLLREPVYWAVQELSGFIRQDLDDLGVGDVVVPVGPLLPLEHASVLGALYVLEGSALGARLLFARAQRLGLSDQFGARHLAVQAGDTTRWKRFVGLLGSVQLDQAAALASAHRMFAMALSIYSEPLVERA